MLNVNMTNCFVFENADRTIFKTTSRFLHTSSRTDWAAGRLGPTRLKYNPPPCSMRFVFL